MQKIERQSKEQLLGLAFMALAKSVEEMYLPMGDHRSQGKFSPETDEYPKS
jgi:hypothetical protein